MTKTTKYTRIFIGDVSRWPRKRQLAKCAEIEPVQKAVYEPNEFDLYVRNLRNNEVALLARLVAIAEKKPKKRPGVAFVLRLVALLDNAAYIHDAETGIKSTDGQKWLDLVEATYNSITQGREISSDRHKELVKKAIEAREPGLIADWKARKGSPEYDAVANVWGNLNIKPAEYAISQLPDKELQGVHPSTMRHIFGSRRACLEYLKTL